MKLPTLREAFFLLARVGIIGSIFMVVSALAFNVARDPGGDAVAATPTQFTQCATPRIPGTQGWARGSTISYDLSGLANQIQIDAAIRALNIMQTAVNSRGMNITFTTRPSDLQLRFRSMPIVMHRGREVAGLAEFTREDGRTGTLEEADIVVTESSSTFDPTTNDGTYFNGLVALFLHELGHTFGLANTDSSCPPSTLSIMNDMCHVNNRSNSISMSVNNCDLNGVADRHNIWTRSDVEAFVPYGFDTASACYVILQVTHFYYNGSYRFTIVHGIVGYECIELET